METTDQVSKAPNPTGKGGFGDNPQNRNPGGWNKKGTARYRLELIIAMGEEELQALIENPATPVFEKRIANAVKSSQWKEIEGMINQVYGRPRENIDVTSGGEALTALVRFEGGDN